MPRRFYFLLTLTVLVGAFLRLWQLTAIPPGLHYDLAATALLGNDIAFNGYRPIFIPAYTGHEVLFYYWLALWFRLVGSSIFTLRLAAATLGILTIPAAFFAVRETLRFEEHSLALAAFAAALLSFAFFHVTFSRFGFRVITEPLIQSLALGFLFRGLDRSERRRVSSDGQVNWQSRSGFWDLGFGIWDLALSGLLTGLAAYTYLAARLFPVPLAVFWLALLLASLRNTQDAAHNTPPASRLAPPAPRSPFRIWLLGFGIFSASALAAFAPLGLYFLRYPQGFFNRAGQVAPRPGETALLLQGIRRAVEMIFVNGEPYDRFNLPGLPLLSPVFGFFFVIGLLITLRNLMIPLLPLSGRAFPTARKRGARGWGLSPRSPAPPLLLQRATEFLLLAWLPAMLLPTAVSVHDIFPSNVRAFGLIPLLFVFPARGLLAAYRWVQSRWPGPLIPHAYPVTLLCLITLIWGAFSTAQDYFVAWANLPNQRLNNDADLTAIAGYLNAQDLGDTSVYVSAIHYRHPTLAYLARNFDSIRWLFGGASLAIPQDRPALYLISRSTPLPDEWTAAWDSHLVAAPRGPDHIPDFRAYRFAAGETPPLPELTPVNENFGNAIFLTGYRFTPHESRLTLDLRWRIENLVEPKDMIPYARLHDQWNNAWSQSGGFNYPSEQWSPGDTLLTRVVVPLPAGMPPGQYILKVGLYSEATRAGLLHLDARGAYAGDIWALPAVSLPAGPPADVQDYLARNAITPPAQPLEPAANLALLGYSLNTASPRQGERLQLTLYWHAPGLASPDPLSILLAGHLLYIGQPVQDTFPFWEWSPGQLVTDRYLLKLAPDFPPGPADLTANLKGYGSATLGILDVIPVERLFTAPAPVIASGIAFSNTIALYGYALQPREKTSLTLYWQALTSDLADYTVFVHVLDAAGQVVAQSDAQPRDGAYPTSLWAANEFISDTYTFDLPPGAYPLELGLYLPETGERLPVVDSAGRSLGDALTLPAFQVP